MLDKQLVIDKMKERGFVVYSAIGKTILQFVSEHMYDMTYRQRVTERERLPIINVLVDLEKDEFKCIYNIDKSINTLNCPSCGSVMNDDHFDSIFSTFEGHAKWMERLR